MKKLDDFIHENREAFDDKVPTENVWSKIQSALPQGRTLSVWNSVMMWRAAAIILFVFSIYLLIPKSSVRPPNHDQALAEFKDVEAFYVEQISQKVELIDQFQQRDGLNGFTQDFKQLEAMYSVLKEEIKNHPSQKVREAMVLNLLVRIDLLNQELHKLEVKHGDTESKEVSS